ncbi:MAG: hypothetical protein P8Q98_01310, partial [Candidatus Poseidoniaceae archaeon]|nr:hypothetical protein [Candidatus Poseidoniaceae archaeon]
AEAPQTVVKSGGVQLPEGTHAAPAAQQQPAVAPTIEQPVPVAAPAAPATPAAPAEQATTKTLSCAACNTGYSVTLPAGVPQAVVACPSCNADNIVTA